MRIRDPAQEAAPGGLRAPDRVSLGRGSAGPGSTPRGTTTRGRCWQTARGFESRVHGLERCRGAVTRSPTPRATRRVDSASRASPREGLSHPHGQDTRLPPDSGWRPSPWRQREAGQDVTEPREALGPRLAYRKGRRGGSGSRRRPGRRGTRPTAPGKGSPWRTEGARGDGARPGPARALPPAPLRGEPEAAFTVNLPKCPFKRVFKAEGNQGGGGMGSGSSATGHLRDAPGPARAPRRMRPRVGAGGPEGRRDGRRVGGTGRGAGTEARGRPGTVRPEGRCQEARDLHVAAQREALTQQFRVRWAGPRGRMQIGPGHHGKPAFIFTGGSRPSFPWVAPRREAPIG